MPSRDEGFTKAWDPLYPAFIPPRLGRCSRHRASSLLDLSFPPFDRDHELVAWPGDLAALMVGVAARQGASPTAIAQARLTAGEEARRGPASFHPAVAAFLSAAEPDADQQSVNRSFTKTGQGCFNPAGYDDRTANLSGTGAPHEDR